MQETLIKKTIRKEKHNKGITLIALVVSIIILLILAGVAIITLTGDNGIITRTSGAKTAIENASVREQVQLAVMAGMSNRDLRVDKEMLEDALTKSFGAKGTGYTLEGDSTNGWTVTVGELSYKVTSTGGMEEVQPPVAIATLINTTNPTQNTEVDKTTAVTDASTTPQTFYIPEKFKLASDTATKVDEGIVVEDESRNQFVWVPVPDVILDGTKTIASGSYTPMATTYPYNAKLDASFNNKTLYRGILYEFGGSDGKTATSHKDDYRVGTTSFREPSLLTGNYNDIWAPMSSVTGNDYDAKTDYTKNILGYTNNTYVTDFGKDLQIDYNAMIESVDKYKGFYVGRYETGYETITSDSNTEIKITSKKASSSVTTLDASQQVKVGDTVVINNTWYGLYNAQKEFATSETVRSSMIWGSQYDAMMNWMAKTGKTVGTSTPMEGLARNRAQTTGSNSADIINNVFDLYGCHFEWTLEASLTKYRAYRGGNYYYSYAPAQRFNDYPTGTDSSRGSRLTLYIVD